MPRRTRIYSKFMNVSAYLLGPWPQPRVTLRVTKNRESICHVTRRQVHAKQDTRQNGQDRQTEQLIKTKQMPTAYQVVSREHGAAQPAQFGSSVQVHQVNNKHVNSLGNL